MLWMPWQWGWMSLMEAMRCGHALRAPLFYCATVIAVKTPAAAVALMTTAAPPAVQLLQSPALPLSPPIRLGQLVLIMEQQQRRQHQLLLVAMRNLKSLQMGK